MKNHTEIPEKKTTITEMKSSLESFKSRLNHAGKRTGDLEDRILEIIQSKKEKELNGVKKVYRLMVHNEKITKTKKFTLWEFQKRKRKMIESIFKAK